MKRIYKYPVSLDEAAGALGCEVAVEMPQDAQVLSAAWQGDSRDPVVWALVDPDRPKVMRTIAVVPTGPPLPDEHPVSLGEARFIGTAQTLGGKFVAHFFDLG